MLMMFEFFGQDSNTREIRRYTRSLIVAVGQLVQVIPPTIYILYLTFLCYTLHTQRRISKPCFRHLPFYLSLFLCCLCTFAWICWCNQHNEFLRYLQYQFNIYALNIIYCFTLREERYHCYDRPFNVLSQHVWCAFMRMVVNLLSVCGMWNWGCFTAHSPLKF